MDRWIYRWDNTLIRNLTNLCLCSMNWTLFAFKWLLEIGWDCKYKAESTWTLFKVVFPIYVVMTLTVALPGLHLTLRFERSGSSWIYWRQTTLLCYKVHFKTELSSPRVACDVREVEPPCLCQTAEDGWVKPVCSLLHGMTSALQTWSEDHMHQDKTKNRLQTFRLSLSSFIKGGASGPNWSGSG